MEHQERRPVLIVDGSCVAAGGHHLTSLLDLIAALGTRRIELAVNARMPAGAFPPGVGVHRCFTSTIYDEPGLGQRPNGRLARRLWKWKRSAAMAAAAAAAASLRVRATLSRQAADRAQDLDWSRWRRKWPELPAVLRDVVREPVAHIVAPSADVPLIRGLAELRAADPRLRDAEVHARLITLTPELGLLTAAGAPAAYRALVAARMCGIHLYVETPAMQRHLRDDYGLPSEVYPYLLNPPQLLSGEPRGGERPISFGYFGAMRNEKGFSRLLPILRLLAAKRPASLPLSFLIHASDADDGEAAELRRAFGAVAGPGLAIELIAGSLDGADYARRFRAIDATLLPYTGARYRLSGSGILCEALAMGKPVIYQRGTSFADFCSTANAIEAGTDAEFADAIVLLAREAEAYRRGAAERAAAYSAEIARSALLSRVAQDVRPAS